MGCHGRQASLGFTTSLHDDQHLPDQPCSTAGASTTRQVSPGPHPDSASITRPQHLSDPVFGWCGVAAIIPVDWRIRLTVQKLQHGKKKYFFFIDDSYSLHILIVGCTATCN